jgi:PAS domain S-box-containing protein
VYPSSVLRLKFAVQRHSTLSGVAGPASLPGSPGLREATRCLPSPTIGNSLLIGAVISAARHAAMAAAISTPSSTPAMSHAISVPALGIPGLGAVIGTVTSFALLLSAVSRRPSAQAEELERRVAERTKELTAVNENLRKEITELRRVGEALRAPEEKFRQLANNIQEIFWMVDAVTKQAIYVNPAFEQITGRTVASLLDAPLSYREILHPDDRGNVLTALEAAARTGVFNEEFRIVRPDGTIRWVSSQGFPVRDGHNKVYRLAGVVQDITERKLAEQALRDSHTELARVTRSLTMGELAASISHEIKQPLTAIVAAGSAALHWLSRHPPDLEEAREAVTGVIRDANHASAVIAKIRALLKGTSPRLRPLDVNDVIREVLALVAKDLVRSGVVVRTALAADVPRVLSDRILLQQVMLNLTMNAIDAMSMVTARPRELVIKSTKGSDGVLIQVEDSGAGISCEQVERIFEPFFTTKADGIGLGLSISRSIVEALGGRLWASSAPPHGALFQFTLPAGGVS